MTAASAVEGLEVPEGYTPVAWARYPTLYGQWAPSKVHLSTDEFSPLCGARRSVRAKRAKTDSDLRDHMRDAGQCARCLTAGRAGR